jgi:transcriptional regulator with XRE-family HTH domain
LLKAPRLDMSPDRIERGPLQQRLGRNVRAYRDEHGLSQEQLAELIGVHRTYVGDIERGERNLSLRSVERLAAALQVEPRDLFGSPP